MDNPQTFRHASLAAALVVQDGIAKLIPITVVDFYPAGVRKGGK